MAESKGRQSPYGGFPFILKLILRKWIMLHCRIMMELTDADRVQLINDVASRAGTADEIAKWYATTVDELRVFVEANRGDIERTRELIESSKSDDLTNPDVTPRELDELWISKKAERLTRYELVANRLYGRIMGEGLEGTDLATALREFRSYLVAAANELGQLLHRGSGESADGDVLSVDFPGVDLGNLK